MRTSSNITSHGQLQGVTANQHHAQVHGPADHNDRTYRRALPVMGAFSWNAGGAAAEPLVHKGTFPIDQGVGACGVGQDRNWSWYFRLPENYVSGLIFNAAWYTLASDAGVVPFRLNVARLIASASPESAGSTTQSTLPCGSTTNFQSTALTTPGSGYTAADLLRVTFNFSRGSDVGSDTCVTTVYLLALLVQWTGDQ